VVRGLFGLSLVLSQVLRTAVLQGERLEPSVVHWPVVWLDLGSEPQQHVRFFVELEL
jgi:hypothetical protein